ncbi:MAG TPA: hypothetical protein VFQ85_10650 [Mycobacteriales bacterium]|jgi:hypothetical protein|nr:hypothetical protein [Mycobacteriales bacterium]
MRWPWRRGRRAAGRVVFIGTSPFDVAQVIASVPTPSPVVSAWVPEPDPEPEPEAETAGVQLGFADGTTMTLADDDPRAVALRALATRLTVGEPART